MNDLPITIETIKEIKPHPNADRLQIAVVKGWETIVPLGTYKEGDKVIYIQPDAILPEQLHTKLGVTQYCAQLPHNYYGETKFRPTARRVKAARLRGTPSYGLIANLSILPEGQYEVGQEVGEILGITKWEPPQKPGSDEIYAESPRMPKYTKIQHYKNYPDILIEGEEVVIHEKIHGQNLRVCAYRENYAIKYLVGSHNTTKKEFNSKGERSSWWSILDNPNIKNLLDNLSYIGNVVVYGENYGCGIQDMHYGLEQNQQDIIIFDIMIDGQYLNHDDFRWLCDQYQVKTPPLLYRGTFRPKLIEEYTDGPTMMCPPEKAGKFKGREGIVIKPAIERSHPLIGRVIFKSVSVDYLNRRGGTDGH